MIPVFSVKIGHRKIVMKLSHFTPSRFSSCVLFFYLFFWSTNKQTNKQTSGVKINEIGEVISVESTNPMSFPQKRIGSEIIFPGFILVVCRCRSYGRVYC